MKRIVLLSLLMLALTFSVGCAKRDQAITDANAYDDVAYVEFVEPEVDYEFQEALQFIDGTIVYFNFNEYSINEQYRSLLKDMAYFLQQYPNVVVRIEGNTDARGTQEYNLALGERRARAAYEYLVLLGVNPQQLEAISYGKERPAIMGTSEEAYAANRRDNFRVISY